MSNAISTIIVGAIAAGGTAVVLYLLARAKW